MVYETQESQVYFLFCNKSPSVVYWAYIDKDVSNDPSSVFLDFHKSIQNFQQESSFLSFVDNLLNHTVELGHVQKNQKCQLLSQIIFPFLQVENQGFNKSDKFLFQSLTWSEVDQCRQTYFGKFFVVNDFVDFSKKLSSDEQFFGLLSFGMLENDIKCTMFDFNFGLLHQCNKFLNNFRSELTLLFFGLSFWLCFHWDLFLLSKVVINLFWVISTLSKNYISFFN